MNENALMKSPVDGAVTGFRHALALATSSEVHGKRVIRTLGLVRGNTIRARHVGRDILAVFKSMVGGELSDYTKLMAEAREQAIDRMVDQAKGLGANAVVDVRLTTSVIMGGAAELLAYGTAVVVEDAPQA